MVISESSLRKWVRKSFSRSPQFLIATPGSFMNHSKAIPLKVPMNKRVRIASFDTALSVWNLKLYMCWFGDPLPSKAYRVGALNLGGYGTRSQSARYGRPLLLVGGLSDWLGPEDVAPVFSSF